MTNKDALEHMSQFVCAILDWWRLTDVTLWHDQETCAWCPDSTELPGDDVDTAHTWSLHPVASRQSVGAIERANQEEANQSRALKLSHSRSESVACEALSDGVSRTISSSHQDRTPFDTFKNKRHSGEIVWHETGSVCHTVSLRSRRDEAR